MNADNCPAPGTATADVFPLHVYFRAHPVQIPEVINRAAMVFAPVTLVKLLQPGTGELIAFVAEP
ncbi:hypothetical protein SDC9_08837 [bioreactor metagenome]|jgi:hypothetical protein|uniref:Uncharacterized protein n=1 Tax=bioreactor metagenome TaxID=1076179 RepID=A0A644T8E7_9ZZZZ